MNSLGWQTVVATPPIVHHGFITVCPPVTVELASKAQSLKPRIINGTTTSRSFSVILVETAGSIKGKIFKIGVRISILFFWNSDFTNFLLFQKKKNSHISFRHKSYLKASACCHILWLPWHRDRSKHWHRQFFLKKTLFFSAKKKKIMI